MSSEDAMLARMRASRVPPHAYMHSMQTLGQRRFSEAIEKKRYDRGVGGLVSYLVVGGRKERTASLVAAVAAKELTVLNRKVKCVSLAELVSPRWGEDSDVKVGAGWLVVCDLGLNTAKCAPFDWEIAQSILLQHIARGGALILGVQKMEDVMFGTEFQDALEIFDNMKVE